MSLQVVDDVIFNQLVEMDDDDQHEFTKSILQDFFEQMDENMIKLDELLAAGDLVALGKLGHFLKGSSAGVGAAIVRDICDDIQHYALKSNEPYKFLAGKIADLKVAVPIAKKELYSRIS